MNDLLPVRETIHKLYRELHRQCWLIEEAKHIGIDLNNVLSCDIIEECILDLLGVPADTTTNDNPDVLFCRDYFTDIAYETIEQNRFIENNDIDAFMGTVFLAMKEYEYGKG